jgi:hypothetical protein
VEVVLSTSKILDKVRKRSVVSHLAFLIVIQTFPVIGELKVPGEAYIWYVG